MDGRLKASIRHSCRGDAAEFEVSTCFSDESGQLVKLDWISEKST